MCNRATTERPKSNKRRPTFDENKFLTNCRTVAFDEIFRWREFLAIIWHCMMARILRVCWKSACAFRNSRIPWLQSKTCLVFFWESFLQFTDLPFSWLLHVSNFISLSLSPPPSLSLLFLSPFCLSLSLSHFSPSISFDLFNFVFSSSVFNASPSQCVPFSFPFHSRPDHSSGWFISRCFELKDFKCMDIIPNDSRGLQIRSITPRLACTAEGKFLAEVEFTWDFPRDGE